MPYIDKKTRLLMDTTLRGSRNAGELNYEITRLIRQYLENNAPLNYQIINDIVGALEGAKLEFVRRIVNPYEDYKIDQNGDVYND